MGAGPKGHVARLAWLLCIGQSVVFADVANNAQTKKSTGISLIELERAAERHYPSVHAARHAVMMAEARMSEARWSPFFQFIASAGMGWSPEVRGSPIFSQDSQLPIRNDWKPIVGGSVAGMVPIYTFGKISGARDAAGAGIEASQADASRVRRQLQYDVRRAYFGLRVALDLQQMLDEGQDKLKKGVEALEAKIKKSEGDTTEMDRWRLASTLAEVTSRASEVDRLKGTAQEALRILTGIQKPEVPECIVEPAHYELSMLEHYVNTALLKRPELKMVAAGVKAREAQKSIATGNLLPDFGLQLGASKSYAPGITDQTNPFIIDQANYQTLSVALGARWSLDVPGNLARRKHAEEQLNQALAQQGEARKGVELEVVNIFYLLKDAARREEAWRSGKKEARAWFIAAGQAYQLGTIEAREFVDAIRAYFTARASYMEAVREYNTQLANLERAVGIQLLQAKQWETPCEE